MAVREPTPSGVATILLEFLCEVRAKRDATFRRAASDACLLQMRGVEYADDRQQHRNGGRKRQDANLACGPALL